VGQHVADVVADLSHQAGDGGEVGFAGEQGVLEAEGDEAADDLADGHVPGVELAAALVDELDDAKGQPLARVQRDRHQRARPVAGAGVHGADVVGVPLDVGRQPPRPRPEDVPRDALAERKVQACPEERGRDRPDGMAEDEHVLVSIVEQDRAGVGPDHFQGHVERLAQQRVGIRDRVQGGADALDGFELPPREGELVFGVACC